MDSLLEGVFLVANVVAFLGWLVLVVLPNWDPGNNVVAPVVIPLLLATVYVAAMASGLPGADGDFMSLAGVTRLLASPVVMLGGWIHYLAFDLVVGAWESRDAKRLGLPHAVVVPCLILTFVLGPAGLLAYLIVRIAARKRLAV